MRLACSKHIFKEGFHGEGTFGLLEHQIEDCKL